MKVLQERILELEGHAKQEVDLLKRVQGKNRKCLALLR